MADDQAVAERGVLTATAGTWDLAVRRAGVIGELAAQPVVGTGAADAAAAELGVSRRQVYLLVRRWRWVKASSRICCLARPAVAAAAGGCRTL
jgi:putative transposase